METDKYSVEHVSWYVKGLSLSGQSKYKAVINKVIDEGASEKSRKHAKKALKQLDLYANWNPIISVNLYKAPSGILGVKKALNMLQSDDLTLQKIGAKRIYHKYRNETELLETSKRLLLASYKAPYIDQAAINTMAWLCKALGSSGNVKYKEVLEEVGNNAKNKKVRKYAMKVL